MIEEDDELRRAAEELGIDLSQGLKKKEPVLTEDEAAAGRPRSWPATRNSPWNRRPKKRRRSKSNDRISRTA